MSWKVVKIGELIESFSVKAKDYNIDVTILDFFGVSNTEGITNSKYAAEDKANDYKIMEKGCFAYNPYRVNVGSIAMLDKDIVGLISPAYVVFKVKKNSIIPKLLLNFLKSSEGLRQIKLHARGTVRQALRFSDLCNIEISLPNYNEQKEFYKTISNTEVESCVLSKELTHQLYLVKQLRQSFLREAMQGKLVAQNPTDEPATELLAKIKAEKEQLIKEKKIKKQKPLPPITKEEIPFELPKGWVWCRLGEVAELKSGNQYKYPKADKGVMFAKVGDMNLAGNEFEMTISTNYFEKSKIKSNDLIEVGSIIFPKRGGAIATNKRRIVGKEPIVVDSNTMAVKSFDGIYFNFFFHWFSGIDLSNFGNEGIIPQVNNKDINPLLIPIPPLSEQKRIVAKLDKLMAYCNNLEESIKNSQTQNEMLLGQVLREALKPKN